MPIAIADTNTSMQEACHCCSLSTANMRQHSIGNLCSSLEAIETTRLAAQHPHRPGRMRRLSLCRAGEGLQLLPGAKDLLQQLQQRPDVHVALVTGNLEPIAWGKMEALGIAGLFTQPKFGGFGSDYCSGNVAEPWRDRAEMIRIARRKAPGACLHHVEVLCQLNCSKGQGKSALLCFATYVHTALPNLEVSLMPLGADCFRTLQARRQGVCTLVTHRLTFLPLSWQDSFLLGRPKASLRWMS
jgi:haloacid dehalogenase-like hydrolase